MVRGLGDLRDQYYRWMYRGKRPNWWARWQNRLSAIQFSKGWFLRERVAALELPGRRTGRVISFPVAIADYGGERYLVAMLGENVNWVRNLRAAKGRAVLRHGRVEFVRLEEVAAGARAPILRRYLEIAPGCPPARAGGPASPAGGVRADRPAFPGLPGVFAR